MSPHAKRDHPALFPHPARLALLGLFLAALACRPGPQIRGQSVARQPTPTSEAEERPPAIPSPLATGTPLPTVPPTATWTPSSTPTATATLVPTRTPTLIPTGTPTRTPQPTPTDTPTATLTPANTNTPTQTPTLTSTTTQTAPPQNNRLNNPGFEGNTRPVIFGEVNVFEGWEPFYCDEPYVSGGCPAERIGSGNPEGLMMGRPEYKLTAVTDRVHGGATAQQWFCFFRTCRAGVFQTFATTPGEVCEVGAWVQSWSAGDEHGTDGQLYHSWTASEDDRANSTWRIIVDPNGGTYAFASGLLTSRDFTYADGHYDHYIQISFTFTATGDKATVFFENLRLWPFAHNDNYIDDAYANCHTP